MSVFPMLIIAIFACESVLSLSVFTIIAEIDKVEVVIVTDKMKVTLREGAYIGLFGTLYEVEALDPENTLLPRPIPV